MEVDKEMIMEVFSALAVFLLGGLSAIVVVDIIAVFLWSIQKVGFFVIDVAEGKRMKTKLERAVYWMLYPAIWAFEHMKE